MKPIWARKFEPPSICGNESQEIIETLMKVAFVTGDRKYLEPIPRAIAYLQQSLLLDGRLSRYYELKTNKPLYMSRRGNTYTLTYDDSNLPSHYGWKWESRLRQLERQYNLLIEGKSPTMSTVDDEGIRQTILALDDLGRWVSTYNGERLVGQPKIAVGAKYLSSELFSQNLTNLSDFLQADSSKKNGY